ncbi:MAG: tripartite tricarboxylate transporter substrate binding protein [Paracoccus sp. (in: a-proteobacteria)]|uniref:tripartite tricarboxylate transporter substrate binding protein n=1 Tax=Paracoccus sp. TaxID=267 RepID=UPI003919A905
MTPITTFRAGLLGAALLLPLAAQAQDYPQRDIMHIMPWAAGGGTDTVMRSFLNFAEAPLGVGINTQNIPGAQSGVGTMRLMRARPDGYTIGSLTWDSVITVPQFDLVPGYHTENLAYIGSVTVHPTALVVRADSDWTTLDEFVEAARAAPGQLTISNVGSGGVWHLPALDFADVAGIEVRHVPYPDGSGSQREALLSGETDAASLSVSAAYPAIQSGDLRVLGVMAEERSADVPDVPTFQEAGYDVIWGSFRLLAAPAGTPDEDIATLARAFETVFENPEFQALAEKTAMGPLWMGPEETAAYVARAQERAFGLIESLVEQGLLED